MLLCRVSTMLLRNSWRCYRRFRSHSLCLGKAGILESGPIYGTSSTDGIVIVGAALRLTLVTGCGNQTRSCGFHSRHEKVLNQLLSSHTFYQNNQKLIFCPHHHFFHLKRDAAFIFLEFKSDTRNGCPSQGKCSSKLGPSEWATKHLCPFSNYVYH